MALPAWEVSTRSPRVPLTLCWASWLSWGILRSPLEPHADPVGWSQGAGPGGRAGDFSSQEGPGVLWLGIPGVMSTDSKPCTFSVCSWNGVSFSCKPWGDHRPSHVRLWLWHSHGAAIRLDGGSSLCPALQQ